MIRITHNQFCHISFKLCAQPYSPIHLPPHLGRGTVPLFHIRRNETGVARTTRHRRIRRRTPRHPENARGKRGKGQHRARGHASRRPRSRAISAQGRREEEVHAVRLGLTQRPDQRQRHRGRLGADDEQSEKSQERI